MAKQIKIPKEFRITFKEDEEDLKMYIFSKSSYSAFLKDLARVEMKREQNIINGTFGILPLNYGLQPMNFESDPIEDHGDPEVKDNKNTDYSSDIDVSDI